MFDRAQEWGTQPLLLHVTLLRAFLRQSFAERWKPPAVYLETAETAWHVRLPCHSPPVLLRLFLLKVQSFCVEYDRSVMFLV